MKWSELKNTPVISLADASRLGFVDDAYLDQTGQTVLGFAVRRGGLLTRHSATVFADVQAIGADALTVRDASALNDPKRFSDLENSLMAEEVLGSNVVTEGGDKIGAVGNLILSDDVHAVTELVLSEGLLGRLRGKEQVIPVSAVQSWSDQLVIVDNSAALQPD